MESEEHSQSEAFSGTELDLWKMLERDSLDFRFVQDPVFNLSEAEEAVLERLRQEGLHFGLKPRQDPSSFLRIKARLNGTEQLVEIAVDPGQGGYVSFITRRTPFAEKLAEWLLEVLGSENFDRSRCVMTRRYVWLAFYLQTRPRSESSRRRSSLFNFDAQERQLLDALEEAVGTVNPQLAHPLQVRVYPRETSFGGIELMLSNPHVSQPARVFVKGLYPTIYHVLTENTQLGQQARAYFDRALGSDNLDGEASRLEGKFLSLVYRLRHPLEL